MILSLIPAPYRMTALACVALIVAAACFAGGWSARDLLADAQEAKVLRAHEAALREAMARDRTIRGAIAAQLANEREKRESDAESYRRRLRNEKPSDLVACPEAIQRTRVAGAAAAAPGAPVEEAETARSAPVFSARFLRLWDDALSIGLQTDGAGRPDGALAGPGLSDPRELLANVEANARRHNACGSALNGWQRWACRHGFATEAQCKLL